MDKVYLVEWDDCEAEAWVVLGVFRTIEGAERFIMKEIEQEGDRSEYRVYSRKVEE